MNKFLQCLDAATNRIGACFLGMLIIISFLQVVCRYCFNNALSWPEEVCRYFFIAIAYIGGALTMRGNGHLRVDVALTFSGPRMKKFFNILTHTCSIFYCVACTYLSWDMMLEVKGMNQHASSIDMEVWFTWIPIPIGFFLMALYAVLLLVKTLRNQSALAGTE